MVENAAPTTANVAASDASRPAEAASPSIPAKSLPELLSEASFDVEDMMAAQDEQQTETEPEENAETGDNDEAPSSEAKSENEEAAADEETSPEANAETAELTEEEKAAVKPKTLKRLNVLLKQRDEALSARREMETRVKDLEAQLSTKEDKPAVVSVSNDPLAAVTNTEQLEATEANAKAWRRWCRSNPNGGTPPIEGFEEMEPEQVASALEWAENVIDNVPKKAQFLADFQKTRAEVKQAMPRMFTQGTEENKAHQAYQRTLLNFRTAADQDKIIAKLIRADLMENEERTGVAKYPRVEIKPAPAKTAAKPIPKAAADKATVPAVKPASSQSQANPWEQLNRPGAIMDIEELMAAQ